MHVRTCRPSKDVLHSGTGIQMLGSAGHHSSYWEKEGKRNLRIRTEVAAIERLVPIPLRKLWMVVRGGTISC